MINKEAINQIIDLTYLETISGGDSDFEREMIQSLMTEIDQKMQAVQAGAFINDSDAVRLNAHSLKNLYGMLGAPVLGEVFYSIEMGCAVMPVGQMAGELAKGQQQWSEIKTALEKIVSGWEPVSS